MSEPTDADLHEWQRYAELALDTALANPPTWARRLRDACAAALAARASTAHHMRERQSLLTYLADQQDRAVALVRQRDAAEAERDALAAQVRELIHEEQEEE